MKLLGWNIAVFLISACSSSTQFNRFPASKTTQQSCVKSILSLSEIPVKAAVEKSLAQIETKFKNSFHAHIKSILDNANSAQVTRYKAMIESALFSLPDGPVRGSIDSFSQQIRLQTKLEGTELASIYLVHELQHGFNQIGSGGKFEVARHFWWMTTAKNSVFRDEESAFTAQYKFIRRTVDQQDLEVLDQALAELQLFRFLAIEEKITRGAFALNKEFESSVRARRLRSRAYKSRDEELQPIREFLKQMNADELDSYRKYYEKKIERISSLKVHLDEAFAYSLDEYVRLSIQPYRGKQELQSLTRYILLPTTGLLIGALAVIEATEAR